MMLRSRRVVTLDGVRPACVAVEQERIRAVLPYDVPIDASQTFDVGDHIVMPGLIDTHVHLNEPGRTNWEGFETGTRAAAAGGITTIVDMPLNCIPGTTTVEALEQKRAAAQGRCTVDYGFWGGVVAGNAAQIEPLARAGVLGFKCFLADPGVDSFTMVTHADLDEAMPVIARKGLPLLVHAEVPGPIDEARLLLGPSPDWTAYRTYLASRPDLSELQSVRLMVYLSRRYACRVHIVHLSSWDALPDLRAARRDGVRISVETCPHYLHFAAESIADGATNWKCAPPIRSASNRERLWQALRHHDIDMVVSDHSPCSPEVKQRGAGDFSAAEGGIASLQLGLPLMWGHALARGIGIESITRWMSIGPAKLAGLQGRKGRIAPGFDADLVVFDPDASFEVKGAELFHRHPMTPYEGEHLRGVVKQTYVRGHLVYEQGRPFGAPVGRECRA